MTSAERYIGVDELINSDEYSHTMGILRQFLSKNITNDTDRFRYYVYAHCSFLVKNKLFDEAEMIFNQMDKSTEYTEFAFINEDVLAALDIFIKGSTSRNVKPRFIIQDEN